MVHSGETRNAGTQCKPYAKSAIAIAGFALFLGPFAGVAHADSVNWDDVAECESGGNWHADTGNGFYGGLQFKQSTWDENGGHGSPAKASRNQQIKVAERVLKTQGPEAWPTCGPDHSTPREIVRYFRHPFRTLWSKITHR